MSIINLASVHENNALCADFSIEIAVVLYESDEQYPVDFELAWLRFSNAAIFSEYA
ncbi:hypothetical protein [Scytonema sp. PCC 10023]|uniref:hypothetical protein n=1 Tax=Scytonema sp. PCC 10023 TaxID=1680591 RepID=UPI0039C66BF4